MEQRFSEYHVFAKLPAITGLPDINLQTMRQRVRHEPTYGPDELLHEARLMGQNLQFTLSQLFHHRKHMIRKWTAAFSRFITSLEAEISLFKQCADCVAYYYAFDDAFLIPCRKPHALVLVLKHRETVLQPGKVIALDHESDQVRVALFDGSNARIWVPRSDTVLLCHRTWSFVWQRDWSSSGHKLLPFRNLFQHLLLLTARFGLWFVGAAASAQSVTQATVHIPDSFFVPMAQATRIMDTLFVRSDVMLKSLKSHRMRKDERKKCRRRGCKRRGHAPDWGIECLLCHFRYCSSECVDADTAAHARVCNLSKGQADVRYIRQHKLSFDPETAEIVAEALVEAQEQVLFGTDDSLQLVNRRLEQMFQCQDQSGTRVFAGDH